MLLTIDASKHSVPWALWRDGALYHCGHDRVAGTKVFPAHVQIAVGVLRRKLAPIVNLELPLELIVELPRVYPRDRNKRPNDLIDLAAAAGTYAVLGHIKKFVHPRTWKGQVPKDIMVKRILARLTDKERAVYDAYEVTRTRATKPDDNVVDAIGIGLWKEGRL